MMTVTKKSLFCGPTHASFRQILGSGRSDNPSLWFGNARTYYVHMARVAIRRACELLHLDKGCEVLAPAYCCGTEIDALRSNGTSVVLYRVDKNAQIDLTDLRSRVTHKTKAICVIHYFGFPQPVAEIKGFCEKKGIYLIEDCALSLFSKDGETRIGTIGDVSVFNFPKILPVPDGGVLVINNPDLAANHWIMKPPSVRRVSREMLPLLKRYVLHVSSGSGIFYSLLWYLLKKNQTEHNHYKSGKTSYPEMPYSYYYDENLSDRKISKITKRMLGTFDVPSIVSRRCDNFITYLRLLSDVKKIKPLFKGLPDGVCPLFFPITVNNREELCRELNEQSIDAVAFWSGYHRDLPWDDFPDACFLKENLLALPVHHQLNTEHIRFIAEKVIDSKKV